MTSDNGATAPAVRIGDAERNIAADALGEHLRAGRLAPAEYDERVQVAFAARTAAEIGPLFGDLPGGSPLTPRGRPEPQRNPRYGDQRRGPHLLPSGHRRGFGLPRSLVVVLLVAGAVTWVAVTHLAPFLLFPLLFFFVLRGPRRFRHARTTRGCGRRR